MFLFSVRLFSCRRAHTKNLSVNPQRPATESTRTYTSSFTLYSSNESVHYLHNGSTSYTTLTDYDQPVHCVSEIC